ncbi:hypothetical protein [Kingella denitrificans]|uniref:hypothetical protein n=1 Tax=Kingella denitrificans TaxID=502 RepID=UPI0011C048B8|nr:hypothetical protein [Kingella denitrificans]QQB41740.1 hypothetical protein I6I17_09740 [Kingella denitrificans]
MLIIAESIWSALEFVHDFILIDLCVRRIVITTIGAAAKGSIRASCKISQSFISSQRRWQTKYGLPDIAYPVRAANLKSTLLDNGDLPLAAMLHGLQQRSRDGEVEWQRLEPAMDRPWHKSWHK